MLGLALFSATALETVSEALLYGLGAALILAVLSASFLALRERIDVADVPMIFRGIPIALITAGFMALALMCFAGMVRN
jgi:electron transport complex protein RnfA